MKVGLFIALFSALCLGAAVPLVPSLAPLPVRTNYAIVLAQYRPMGPASAFSNEVTTTNVNAVLSWDASPDPAARYLILWGTNSGVYTRSTWAGSNTTAKLVSLAKDRVVTVTPLQSATVRGPWSAISNWPSINFTNPSADKLFKYQITETNL